MAKEDREIREIKRGHYASMFLKGPVPMYWFQNAALLPGRDVFKIAMVLWYLKGLKNTGKNKDVVYINRWTAAQFGVAPRTLKNCLDALAEAKLIKYIKQGRGQRPVVKLIHTKIRKGKVSDKPEE